jgi:hypothetical protein
MGTSKGNYDGQRDGINNGTEAGKRRCYEEGYTKGYNSAYAEAKILGLQDLESYNTGFKNGQKDAAVIEADRGQKAGYQAGFSERENELQNSLENMKVVKSSFLKSATLTESMNIPIEVLRAGYSTPQEREAYERGYRDGYQRAYGRAYEEAKRSGYNERYYIAYRQAYDAQFSISYREGFAEGKEQGYQDAYYAAYNSAYSSYYDEYKNREYPDQRVIGLNDGQNKGKSEGFAAGCAEQTKKGYQAGYEKTAAEIYPSAFELGKQSGRVAAEKYYSENAVLKVFDASFYDENNDGSFQANENINLKAEIKNFGFQVSNEISITVKSERGEINFVPNLRSDSIAGRTKTMINLNIGKLYDVAAPGADTLYVTFYENGKVIGDFKQIYSRTNASKVGVIAKDGTSVLKKATWFFPGEITKLNHGEKVIIIEEKGDYYKVHKSQFAGGDWTEGYIKKEKLNLQ